MILIHFCLALLVLVAGMQLLAKTQKENLGAFFKWVSYGVITLAVLILICRTVVTCMRMMGGERNHHEMMMGMRHRGNDMDCCMGMNGKMMMNERMGKREMECCDEDSMRSSSKGGMMMEDDDDDDEGVKK